MKFQSRYPSAQTPMLILAAAQFQTPLTDDSEARIPLLESGGVPLKNMGRVPGSKKRSAQLVVRMSLGRELLTVALRPIHDLTGACRLADCATRYFWKYRIRLHGAETDRYNFSPVQADLDLTNEPAIRDTLADLERAWVRDGGLPDSIALASRKREEAARLATPKVKTALRKQVDGWAEAIGELAKGNAQNFSGLATLVEEQRQGFLTARAERLGDRQHLDSELASIQVQIANLVIQFQRIADSVDTIAKAQVKILQNTNK